MRVDLRGLEGGRVGGHLARVPALRDLRGSFYHQTLCIALAFLKTNNLLFFLPTMIRG